MLPAAAALAYLQALADLEAAAADVELETLLPELETELAARGAELEAALAPPTLANAGDGPVRVIVELRQGVGGEEAALWTASLARMLVRFCERSGLEWESVSRADSKGGKGIKEAVLAIRGAGAGALLLEAGVHRVQRVSPTDTRGRVHTSAASIAVLPEPEEASFELAGRELKVETFRCGGNGGQNVNKVESGVRITDVETGISAISTERHQAQNREQARRVLVARLAERERAAAAAERAGERSAQIGRGDRSEKTRTYNFLESRVTDHRIGLTVHRLDAVLDGELEWLHEPLRAAQQTAA